MQAAFYYGHKDIRVLETKEPDILPKHVKIKVAWAGICGTDRHEYTGPNFIPTTKPHRLTNKTAPLIMGHELTGIVTEIGEGVADISVGDRVSCSGTLCCGTCPLCREGRINICQKLGFNGVSDDGAFAEMMVVPAYQVYKIPPQLDMRTAVLCEPLSCGEHAVGLMGGVKGLDVFIAGDGIIGLSALLAAKLSGAKRIFMSGAGCFKQGVVEEYGGVYIDAEKEDVLERITQETEGSMCDAAFECVGLEKTLHTCINVLRCAGKLMVMGVFEEAPTFPMNFFQEGERQLYTSQAYLDEMGMVLQNMAEHKYGDLQKLITAEIALKDIVSGGFEELLINGKKHTKVLIRLSAEM